MEGQKWRRGGVLGRGSCATVSIATNSVSGKSVAVKSVPMSRAEVLRSEESILSSLDSPFVVAYLGSDVSGDTYGGQLCYDLYLEYAPGGSLADEVRRDRGRVAEPLLRARTFEILAGLVYLHDMGIVHCDIKGQNVLVGSDGRAKIADFGCAKHCELREDRMGLKIRGTPMYMAPEVARGEEQGTPADVWALGCTIIEMATGGVPWAGFSDPVSVLHHIGYSSDIPAVPNWVSSEAKDFLSKCLIRDPNNRWSGRQLIKHPFVASSDNPELDKSASSTQSSSSWVSPKSTLDQGIWESETLDIESESAERIRSLVGSAIARPDWDDCDDADDGWITVRCSTTEDSDEDSLASAATTSTSSDAEEGNLCNSHMETEEFQFNAISDFDCFEGTTCKNNNNFRVSDFFTFSDLLMRRKELNMNMRYLIGYYYRFGSSLLHFLISMLLLVFIS